MTKKLVCAIGAGSSPYEETTYYLGEAEKTTNLAPIAVGYCAIKPNEDLELVALMTGAAEEQYGEQLKAEAENEGWACTKVRIPEVRSEEELWRVFDILGDHLEDGDDIVLDLTHGLRHIPALLLSATQYYAARKKLNLLGIFYGAFEVRENGKTPIFDLTPLYDLSEWAYGVRLLRDYQFSAPLGEMLHKPQNKPQPDRSEQSRPERHGTTSVEKLGRSLKRLQYPLVSSIPLESGFEAHEALKNARDAEDQLSNIPPMKELWRELEGQLKGFELEKPKIPTKQRGTVQPKQKIQLTQDELERQSRLIEGYFRSDNLSAAANLLREWMISTIIFHSGDTENWLSYGKRREPMERKLGALSEWNKHEKLKIALTEDQEKLVVLWQSISKKRNDLAHAGMKEEMTKFDPDTLRRPFEELKAKLTDAEFWSVKISVKTDKVWLISPLGTTPGAIFTAIKKAKPDRLLVVTSEQGKELVPEILRKAGREDLSVRYSLLDDPFNGFSEAKKVVDGLRRERGLDWIRAKELTVNLTGGTTCLGWTAGRIGETLARMGLEPKTVACIDRRTPEEQRRTPYQEGEMQNIEPDEESQ